MTNPPEVHYEIVDRIAYITIDRPEARNAINPAVRKGLIESFSDASVNPDVWVVVLTGSGDRAFLQRYKHMAVKGWDLCRSLRRCASTRARIRT